MAKKFSLNTAGISGLSQVVAAMPSGNVYDHKVREAAGVVDLSAAAEADVAAARKLKKGSTELLTEA